MCTFIVAGDAWSLPHPHDTLIQKLPGVIPRNQCHQAQKMTLVVCTTTLALPRKFGL